MICPRVKPTHSPASIWPFGTARNPEQEDFAEIGRAIDRNADQSRRHGIKLEADERAAIIDEEDLDEKRRAAQHRHDGTKHLVDDHAAILPGDRHQEADNGSGDGAHDPDHDRDAGTAEDGRPLADEDVDIEGHRATPGNLLSIRLPASATTQLITR